MFYMHRSINCFLYVLVFASSVSLSLPARSNSDSLQLGLTEAIQLAVADKHDDARDLLKKISTQYPDSPEAYNNLAVLAAYSEDWKSAVSLLEKALATNRNLQTSYQNLNRIYRYQAALAYRAALPDAEAKPLALPGLIMLTTPPPSTVQEDEEPVFNWESAATRLEPEPEPKPEPTPAKPVAIDIEATSRDISDALQKWAAAWSAQNVDSYLSSYIDNYIPDGGDDHQHWRQLRRKRLLAPAFINVSISNTSIEVLSPQSAMIIFTQHYRSTTLNDSVRKLMVMQHTDNGWSISREHIVR